MKINISFYTEIDKIKSQSSKELAFGPLSATEYNLESLHEANENLESVKAFAVLDGRVFVQENSTGDRYNIVLIPEKILSQNTIDLQYIVYRGIKKTSIINSSGYVDVKATNHSNKLLEYVYSAIKKKNNKFDPSVDKVEVSSIGIEKNNNNTNLYLDDDLLSRYSSSTFKVKAGDYIGDFDCLLGDKYIGIQFIKNELRTSITFREIRSTRSLVTLDPIATSALLLKAQREKILSYIDPCSFYGLMLSHDLNRKDNAYLLFEIKYVKNSVSNILTLLDLTFFDKFYNKSRTYIDIRNDFNNSIYYLGNYSNNFEIEFFDDKLAKVSNVSNFIKKDGWPILIIESSSIAVVKIRLIVSDSDKVENSQPIVFIQNGYLRNISKKTNLNIIEPGDFESNEYSKSYVKIAGDFSISLIQPFNKSFDLSGVTLPTYVNLKFFKDKETGVSSNSIIRKETNSKSYFDKLWLPFAMKGKFKNIDNSVSIYRNEGVLTDIYKVFKKKYVVNIGSYTDKNSVTFFALATGSYDNVSSIKSSAPSTINKKVNGQFLDFFYDTVVDHKRKIYLLKDNLKINNTKYVPLYVINDLVKNTSWDSDFVAIMIEKSKLQKILNNTILDKKFDIFLTFRDVQYGLKDLENRSYSKLEVGLAGYNNSGVVIDEFPSIESDKIIVYSYGNWDNLFKKGDLSNVFIDESLGENIAPQSFFNNNFNSLGSFIPPNPLPAFDLTVDEKIYFDWIINQMSEIKDIDNINLLYENKLFSTTQSAVIPFTLLNNILTPNTNLYDDFNNVHNDFRNVSVGPLSEIASYLAIKYMSKEIYTFFNINPGTVPTPTNKRKVPDIYIALNTVFTKYLKISGMNFPEFDINKNIYAQSDEWKVLMRLFDPRLPFGLVSDNEYLLNNIPDTSATSYQSEQLNTFKKVLRFYLWKVSPAFFGSKTGISLKDAINELVYNLFNELLIVKNNFLSSKSNIYFNILRGSDLKTPFEFNFLAIGDGTQSSSYLGAYEPDYLTTYNLPTGASNINKSRNYGDGVSYFTYQLGNIKTSPSVENKYIKKFNSFGFDLDTSLHLRLFGLDNETAEIFVTIVESGNDFVFKSVKNINNAKLYYQSKSNDLTHPNRDEVVGQIIYIYRNGDMVAIWDKINCDFSFVKRGYYEFKVIFELPTSISGYDEVTLLCNKLYGVEIAFKGKPIIIEDGFLSNEFTFNQETINKVKLENSEVLKKVGQFIYKKFEENKTFNIKVNLLPKYIGKVESDSKEKYLISDRNYHFLETNKVINELFKDNDDEYSNLRRTNIEVLYNIDNLIINIESFVSPVVSRLDKVYPSGSSKLNTLNSKTLYKSTDGSKYISSFLDVDGSTKVPFYNPILSALRCFGSYDAIVLLILDAVYDYDIEINGQDSGYLSQMQALFTNVQTGLLIKKNYSLGIGDDISYVEFNSLKP